MNGRVQVTLPPLKILDLFIDPKKVPIKDGLSVCDENDKAKRCQQHQDKDDLENNHCSGAATSSSFLDILRPLNVHVPGHSLADLPPVLDDLIVPWRGRVILLGDGACVLGTTEGGGRGSRSSHSEAVQG